MKQYEKLGMSTEAALKWVKECHNRVCFECPARSDIGSTALCASSYLLSDVPEPPKVPRWMTAKTQGDFDKLFLDFNSDYCSKFATEFCSGCKYQGNSWSCSCFYEYMSELVEVQE